MEKFSDAVSEYRKDFDKEFKDKIRQFEEDDKQTGYEFSLEIEDWELQYKPQGEMESDSQVDIDRIDRLSEIKDGEMFTGWGEV